MRELFSGPPDLRGRPRQDRMLSSVMAAVVGYENALTAVDRMLRAKVPGEVDLVDEDLRLVIAEVRVEAEDVVSLRLSSPDGEALPRWQPGCHVDVTLPSGKRRQYSLNGDVRDRYGYRIAVRRIDGGLGGSVEMHTLTEGTPIRVSRPRNAFALINLEKYLFLAGGIGITPILPMVRAAERIGADWKLVYTGRSRSSMPFLRELLDINESKVDIRADDEVGMSTGRELLEHSAPGTHVYCCGPIPMIDAVRAEIRETGRNPLHYERFSPAPVLNGKPFEVQLARSGRTIQVGAEQTVLDAVLPEVPAQQYSCKQGFCRTCKVRVLAGEVDHRDGSLTARERETEMTLCVSRAAGDRLVLDI
ncbi:oxidoreductase [Pseudonocardiaceae bacterium YIM PH 21723]|nr:oxidoreductase [Pseudonocardiaceae bacterium YIM PH 21723]